MSNTPRIQARRAFKTTEAEVKRIVLSAPAAIEAPHPAKTLRNTSHAKACFLVIAHTDRGAFDDHARQTIAAAAILAGAEANVVVLTLGELGENIADLGANQVIAIPALDYQIFQPDIELNSVMGVITSLQPTRILMPDNHIGDGDLGRRLIASLPQKTAATQVVEINAQHIARYAQGGTQLVQSALPEILLLAVNAVDAHLPFATEITAATPTPSAPAASGLYSNLGMQTTAASHIALEEADFIVSAGNGVKNVSTLEKLAELFDAAIGASRVAVDDGKFGREKQIGASGKTVNASAYLAIGISGAVQHLQGIKDCRHVIAINRDNSAPIVKRANLTVIGDAEDIMQSLINAISEAQLAAPTAQERT